MKRTTDLTIVGHLAELRKRLVYCAVVFVLAVFIFYNFAEPVVKDIVNITPDTNFVFIAPAELLMSYVKIAVIGGLVISAPFILTQIWLFISPGLNSKEKKYIIVSLFIGGIFFILGVIFSYIIVLPTMIVFFIGFQIEEIQPMISFSNYLSFVITTLLSFGIIFELPIVMVLLTRFNIVNINFFKKNRKMFILVIFIIAAILTPPDVVSQVLLAIPMLALFEIGIILSSIFEKRKKLKTPS
jgi:sec-independent protein translocase protein TatC